jgi:hypothetical protein
MPAGPKDRAKGTDDRVKAFLQYARRVPRTMRQQAEDIKDALASIKAARAGGGMPAAGAGTRTTTTTATVGSGGRATSGGSGGCPQVPGTLEELAQAQASDFNVSANCRIVFLTKASQLLIDAVDDDGVPPELIPPITKVTLDVLDFIDRDLRPADLDTMTALKQQIAGSLADSAPVVAQASPRGGK